ncbi:MAG: acyl-CoA dehydrogenase family protein, partial [Bdellovibrionales bacterium]|nr:acyl-CoA dehydrogenase family protein [Bdellovibrionales bacterium]
EVQLLKLEISEEVEAFRASFRSWLSSNPPPEATNDAGLENFIEQGRQWQSKLASGGWVGVHWPKEYGGRSLSLVEEAVIQEELVRVSSPQLLGLFGLTMVGPVLIKHGTAEQKLRFLSKILSAQEIWCQGFSEPGAGSDLAAIKTRARVSEDGFYISGQKVWTSFAHIADWCFVLCRTSEEKKKHEGLSYLLVDMKSPGISTRPLRQMSGDDEFNEVFFDEVFVPKENIVGEIGDGWRIAISTLMYERVVLTFARQLQSEVALRQLIEQVGRESDLVRQKALAHELATACAVRALAYEHLLAYSGGKSPGPEGSLDKLFWSESFQSISKLAREVRGHLGALDETSKESGVETHRYLYSRGRTIAAGTSEIQRNIIAERILELPRFRYTES